MADGHHFWPGRSVFREFIIGELHKTTTKIYGSSLEKGSASSIVLWPHAASFKHRALATCGEGHREEFTRTML
jgi:hypothetical protein